MNHLIEIVKRSLSEDIIDISGKLPTGDHSALAVFGETKGKAMLLVKDEGILAGVELAKIIFEEVDKDIVLEILLKDGDSISFGDIVLYAEGKISSLLRAERVVLNFMQRMSGIATTTRRYVDKVAGTACKILDTRKTTPNLRVIEKWAVRIGGGLNHRFGLYDMIMLKDNHVDFAGGIENAIQKANAYRKALSLDLKIEIETRNIDEVKKVLAIGGVDRIMLDNFSVEQALVAVVLIDHRIETEASGGITLETIKEYASTGVDYISVGALTHSVKCLDLSFKASILP